MGRERIDTRASLLIRIREPEDHLAWSEFVELYTPMLYAFCRKRQLDHDETQDVLQEIYRGVSKAIARFDYDPRRGHFSSWLFRVASSKIARFYERKNRRPFDARQSVLLRKLDQQHAEPPPDWEQEHRRALFHWAAKRVKGDFAESTWQAFWKVAVEERAVNEVAAELGIRPGSVYVAKSRVLARLREELETVDVLGDVPA